MSEVPSYKAVLESYKTCSPQVREYFNQLPELFPKFPYEVTLAYLFLRTEQAHNRALYCGVVKLHRANAAVAESVVNSQHLTRDGFLHLFKNVFGHPLPEVTREKLKAAEKVRDRVIHGKQFSDMHVREALVDVLEYAESFNSNVMTIAGFKPFGDLRGFKGRGQPLDSTTSRWLLKGLGFGGKETTAGDISA